MTLARGEYLIVMDDDDISLPNRLEEQIKFMDSHPDVTMAGSWCELFSRKPDKGIINYLKYCFYNLGWIWTQKNSPGWEEMFCCNPIMHTTSILRRQHIEQHQIRYNSDYSPAEDYDLCPPNIIRRTEIGKYTATAGQIPLVWQQRLNYQTPGNENCRSQSQSRCQKHITNDTAAIPLL